MKELNIQITGTSILKFSKYHTTEKKDKESDQAFEERTWREKAHYDHDNTVFIPAMMIKNCLIDSAKYLSMQIKGQGKKTYTQKFKSGILLDQNFPILAPQNNHPLKKGELIKEESFMPSAGASSGGKRVLKIFPTIPPNWHTSLNIKILDDTITEEIFLKHLEEAGKFIGIGSFRPANGGMYGRFVINS